MVELHKPCVAVFTGPRVGDEAAVTLILRLRVAAHVPFYRG